MIHVNKISLVLIDFDDTLCMTEAGAFELENDVLVRLGYPKMTRETHQKNWGKVFHEAIVERVPGIRVDEFMKKVAEVLPEYSSSGRMDAVSKENLAVLENLKNKGIKTAILTSRTDAESKHLRDTNHALSRVLDGFFYHGNLVYNKPDPRVIDVISKNMHIPKNEMVFVGDSVSDAVCAQGAGIRFVVCLENGLRDKAEFENIGRFTYISKFSDLEPVIDVLNLQ